MTMRRVVRKVDVDADSPRDPGNLDADGAVVSVYGEEDQT